MSRRDGNPPPPGVPLAIALQYDGLGAPTVTAKGIGELAERIVALAQAHDVPLESDRTLARLLSTLELDEEIPPELYRVVAEVIAFAYLLKGRHPGGSGGGKRTPDQS
ncbi:MAG: EscU/YscU/HrcU family type III secretion system export apparatus switch protein [Ectothiorhodospiraceae bacterium]|nr:EscU/YscU/HrcU family type III secretion system export apparatus switch protein [Ectothiorhodospiraceae bacterium]MCH8504551.1 EscU/YscU/HrcU family type III secretion system export apparatus switch protein [Ectothiorhodospiraceae bacterium]